MGSKSRAAGMAMSGRAHFIRFHGMTMGSRCAPPASELRVVARLLRSGVYSPCTEFGARIPERQRIARSGGPSCLSFGLLNGCDCC